MEKAYQSPGRSMVYGNVRLMGAKIIEIIGITRLGQSDAGRLSHRSSFQSKRGEVFMFTLEYIK